MDWQPAERVQKNDAGEFRAMIGGKWVPAVKAQKNEAGEYRVQLGTASPDPTEGMSTFEKVKAGAGKAIYDIGRGAGQLIGEGLDAIAPGASGKTFSEGLGLPQRRDVDETRKLEAPLMATNAGKAGAIGGGAIPLAAMALLPGANTVAGSALLGATQGAIEPVGTGESRTANTALGGGVGGGSAGVLKLAGIGASKLLGKSTADAAAEASRNSVRDATIKAAQAEGYVLPPSVIGGGSANKLLESIGGKAGMAQEASIRNQQVTNNIARREAGLAADAPISEKSLADARQALSAPYREVADLSPRAEQALEKLKEVRAEATSYWKHYGVSLDPKSMKEAQRLDSLGKSYEKLIDSEASKLGRADLLPELKEARKALAKNYDVERAVNLGSGDVDAKVIGRLLEKRGEAGMSGGLLTIGKFAESFGHYAREGVAPPGVSKLAPYGSIALGAIGGGASQYATGTPYGAAAAALPLLSGPARSMALSRMMQPHPSYGAGNAVRLADLATNNPQLRGMIPLGAAGSALNAQQQ